MTTDTKTTDAESVFSEEHVGPVQDIPPEPADTPPSNRKRRMRAESPPKKEWKPSKGKVSASGSFTPGFVKDRVQECYYTLALTTMPFLPDTSRALFEVSEKAAEVAEDWAQSDPKFREFILRLLKTSHGLQFAMANAPVAMALFADIKDRRATAEQGRVPEGTRDEHVSPVPSSPRPADPKEEMFKKQKTTAKPDAAKFTYKVPGNAVLS